ncbi:MAG: hypothetical protein RR448_08740 [Niameybacter sp.]|uniref:hypothetical protein n=1 Tax=Niameybacter sp. TaxID=2033640 RepID=UPI002FC80DD6
MTLENMKNKAKHGLKDAVEATKLTAENLSYEVKHELNKERIQNKVDNVQEAYHEIKEEVKHDIKDMFH